MYTLYIYTLYIHYYRLLYVHIHYSYIYTYIFRSRYCNNVRFFSKIIKNIFLFCKYFAAISVGSSEQDIYNIYIYICMYIYVYIYISSSDYILQIFSYFNQLFTYTVSLFQGILQHV